MMSITRLHATWVPRCLPCWRVGLKTAFDYISLMTTSSPPVYLPQGLVGRDAGGGGQVQAANRFSGHGQAQSAGPQAVEQARRQAMRLTSKQQAIAVLVIHCSVKSLATGAEREQPGVCQG